MNVATQRSQEEIMAFYIEVAEDLDLSVEERAEALRIVEVFLAAKPNRFGATSEAVLSKAESDGEQLAEVLAEREGSTLTPSVRTSFGVLYGMRIALLQNVIHQRDSDVSFSKQAEPLDEAMIDLLRSLRS
ncbi:MAG: hypothetical protein Q7S63_00890 [bacterium]|nr:hypothetical protein [bacterium]